MTKGINVVYRSRIGRIADAMLGRDYDVTVKLGQRNKYRENIDLTRDLTVMIDKDGPRDVKKLDRVLKRLVNQHGYDADSIRAEGKVPEMIEILVDHFSGHYACDMEEERGKNGYGFVTNRKAA